MLMGSHAYFLSFDYVICKRISYPAGHPSIGLIWPGSTAQQFLNVTSHDTCLQLGSLEVQVIL